MRPLLFALLLLAACAGPASILETPETADTDALYASLENGDTAAMVAQVEGYFRNGGVSWDDELRWQFQRFDGLFNYYDHPSRQIVLSRLPTQDEAAAYWRTWSEALTQGRWRADGFFSDADAMRLMANFNQFMLATHEVAHMVDYRYRPGGSQRRQESVNCQEYFADRLAATLAKELALLDERFDALLRQYRALMSEINGAIAPEQRQSFSSYRDLEEDCARFPVASPTTPAEMVPYASAYFERQRLLLAQPLLAFSEAVDRYLLATWREALAERPYVSSAVSAATLDTVRIAGIRAPNEVELMTRLMWRGTAGQADTSAILPVLDAEGVARKVALVARENGTGLQYTLHFGATDPFETRIVLPGYEQRQQPLALASAVAVSEAEVLALLLEEDDDTDRYRPYLIRATREGASWQTQQTRLPVFEHAHVLRSAGGRLFVAGLTARGGITDSLKQDWALIEMEPQTLAFIGNRPFSAPGYPATADDEARVYLISNNGRDLLRADEAGYAYVAGNGFAGIKDGSSAQAIEFMDLYAAQMIGRRELLVLDRAADPRYFLRRSVRLRWAGL